MDNDVEDDTIILEIVIQKDPLIASKDSPEYFVVVQEHNTKIFECK